jgi:phosphotransferase system HPr (HPr) family protein
MDCLAALADMFDLCRSSHRLQPDNPQNRFVNAAMSNGKASRRVLVANLEGLHLRPASLIARLATKYQSRIEIVKDNSRVDGRSILDIVTLDAPQGTTVVIEAEGPDADSALEALAELFASKFGEDDEG